MQVEAGPIGPIIDGVRSALSWLGPCQRESAPHSMHLTFRFEPEGGGAKKKLKVEINTREHENLLAHHEYPFGVRSSWYRGAAVVKSFAPEELFGTKLRALLQRRKSRDLFDLNHGIHSLDMDQALIVQCFEHYLRLSGTPISRAEAEQRVLERFETSLTEDIVPLLPRGVTFSEQEAVEAIGLVWFGLIARIPGDSWKLSTSIIEGLRESRGAYRSLLRR